MQLEDLECLTDNNNNNNNNNNNHSYSSLDHTDVRSDGTKMLKWCAYPLSGITKLEFNSFVDHATYWKSVWHNKMAASKVQEYE
jgi:hypothetical protein